jgi:hypothetical protein
MTTARNPRRRTCLSSIALWCQAGLPAPGLAIESGSESIVANSLHPAANNTKIWRIVAGGAANSCSIIEHRTGIA